MYITHRAEWSAPALTSVRRRQDAFPQTVATRCPCSARSACGGCPLTHLAQSPVPACATRLPAALRSAVEGLSGLSLSGVRVHYNSALPARFQALAFTQGMHIYLAAGQEEHLGHEAWHVVQQLQGRVSVVGPDGVNHDPVLEAEAEAMGRLAMGRLAVGRLAAGNGAGDGGTRPGRRPVVGRLLAAGRTAPIQLRGANPYAAGGGITSHHVIPHSLLVEMRGMLSPADQATTQAMFLPDFGKLTVATLLEAAITDTVGEPLAIAFNSQQRSKTHITNNNPPGFQVLAQTPFAGLTSAERGALTFDDAPFATFEARYNLLRDPAQNSALVLSEKEQDMLNTFYEWQSGNQFYGSARYEPGTSNDFDSDAQYVLGKDYVADLLIINKELLGYRATAAKTQGVLAGSEQQNLVATLKKLAVLGTPDRPIPANDAGAWTALNSNEKQELLVVIEGYDRVAASGAAGPRDNNKNIHKDIVREGLKKSRKSLWDRDKTSVHDVYDRLNAGSGTVIHPLVASWTIVITKLTLTIAGRKASVTVDKSSISMDTVRDALDELFVATTTEVFGL